METIQVKNGRKYEMETLTKAKAYISYEVRDLLENEFDFSFDSYNSKDVFYNGDFKTILSNKEDYIEDYNLSEEDLKDIEDIVELLEKVDFINIELAI